MWERKAQPSVGSIRQLKLTFKTKSWLSLKPEHFLSLSFKPRGLLKEI